MEIKLPVYNIVVILNDDGTDTVTCDDSLYETCPQCGERECFCENPGQTEKEKLHRIKNNSAVDAILATIVGHARARIAITTPAYLEGIETAFEKITQKVEDS